MHKRDYMKPAQSAFKMGLGLGYLDKVQIPVRGDVFFDMRDSRTGESLVSWEKTNLITLDAGILVARLCKDHQEPNNGINMLAVGTGALGAVLNPDAPAREQRALNNEIARKSFSSTTFRDSQGAAVAIPTNVVDFTAIFGESEAVGPLNEMGLLSTISDNEGILNPNTNTAVQGGQPYDPTVDVTQFDMLVNDLTFAVVSKPSQSILTITWRLTFG